MTTDKAKEIISYHKILVDRDKSGLLDEKLEYEAIDMAVEALENQKTGHWIRLIEDYPNCDFEFKGCSVCRTHYPSLEIIQFRYCPNCGAKMEGK